MARPNMDYLASMAALSGIIGGLAEEREERQLSNDPTRFDPERLKRLNELFHTPYDFKKGDLVQLKKGLETTYKFSDGQPLIVVEVLEKPIIESTTDSSASNYGKPLDIIVGIVISGDHYNEYFMDKRYFEPYVAPETHTQG